MGNCRYDEEFKSEAVRMVVEDKRTYHSVEKALGIGNGVLKDWVEKYRKRNTINSFEKGDLEAENRELKKRVEQITRERDILKKSSGHLLKGPESIYKFIAGYHTEFTVQEMCRILNVSQWFLQVV
ncbi:transposase [Chitinispirillum alkaliphilum]|nr:transposase [Chitinispirillum alkaliphilum]